MNQEKIKEVLNSAVGEDLKEFLFAALRSADSFSGLKDLDDVQEMAIEQKSHKKAVVFLKNLLSEIMDFEDIIKGRKSEKDAYYSLPNLWEEKE